MKLFNTKSNQIEDFVPINAPEVSLYLCGPTVYNYAHIGNARPIVVFDLLRRVLETKGYHVKFVSNYTDVDDKIIRKALEEMTTEKEISERYIHAYESVRQALHAEGIYKTPRVTEVMDDIIAFIKELETKGYAYSVEGDVYFRVRSVSNYGTLSHQNLEALQVGARIDENDKKEDPLDFALWKVTDDAGIKWESPWGMGRPGWHTECVVMIYNTFGTRIDIHGGGQDLKFPHHENEAAQAHALHHHDLANLWVHNAMLNIDGEKMSKSFGNVIWAKDFIEKLGSNATRWLLLSTHYRIVLNITDETIQQAQNDIVKFETVLKQAQRTLSLNHIETSLIDEDLNRDFLNALYDDLNVANATVSLYACMKHLNQALRQKDALDAVSKYTNTLRLMLDVLGLEFDVFELTQAQREMYLQWQEAKANRDFETADALRNVLQAEGVL